MSQPDSVELLAAELRRSCEDGEHWTPVPVPEHPGRWSIGCGCHVADRIAALFAAERERRLELERAMGNPGTTGWAAQVATERELIAERERYAKLAEKYELSLDTANLVLEKIAKLEADYDKLTEMYERALREREDGP